jgi:hypothetical protein
MEMHIFTELVGIQMLLMNTLEPVLRGDKIAQEQLTILFRQAQPEQGEIAMPAAQQGRRESIIWPPRHYPYTLGAIFLWLVATGLFVYIHFQFGLSLLER